jgi:hypothetical protein
VEDEGDACWVEAGDRHVEHGRSSAEHEGEQG